MTIKDSFADNFFNKLSYTVVERPLFVVITCLTLIAILSMRLPQVSLDTSTEGYLHENDPALIAYNEFRQQFGRDEIIVVAINPPDIFDIDFFDKLKQLHQTIENELPYLEEVTSLINARNTYGDKDSLIVEDLLETTPTSKAGMLALKEKIVSNPLYRNLLISESNRFTTLLIKTNPGIVKQAVNDDPLAGFDEPETTTTDSDSENQSMEPVNVNVDGEIVASLEQITSRFHSRKFPISIAGTPVMAESLKDSMRQDMRKFTGAAVLLIIITLFLMFRRLTGVLIPLFVIAASVASTIGLMAWTNTAIKLPTQILPSFLLAVGIAATIHIMSMFFRTFHNGDNKKEAIKFAVQHTGLPVAMTGLTTAIGLWSFSTAEVAPVADLGIFAGLGVIVSLIYTLTLLPALLSLTPIKNKRKSHHQKRHQLMDKMLENISDFSTNNFKCIIISASFILIAAVISLSQLYFYHNPLLWLPEESDIRTSTSAIDQAMRGSNTIEVLIDTGKTNGLYDPEVAKKIDEIQNKLNRNEIGEVIVGKTVAITDVLKETHQALNENNSLFYRVPDNRETIAQELLLFENSGSNDLEELTDTQFSKARLTVKIPWADAKTNATFATQIEESVSTLFGNSAKVSVTGMIAIMGRTMYAAIKSTETSYLIAFVVITLLMIILMRNLKLGLLSMVPNLLPILIILGFMAYRHIPLDMFTMLIGSIAIGIVVDDTIHFLHVFKRNHDLHGNVKQAINETLLTSGRAILITSIVLTCGFFIFSVSLLNNLQAFGLLTGMTIFTALIADLFLLPALLTLLYANKKAKESSIPKTEQGALKPEEQPK